MTARRSRPPGGDGDCWSVLSPDGLPIEPQTYPARHVAETALAAWCQRFTSQGYYAAVGERIPLAALPGRCTIVAAKGGGR